MLNNMTLVKPSYNIGTHNYINSACILSLFSGELTAYIYNNCRNYIILIYLYL